MSEFAAFDAKLAEKNADYDALYQELIAKSKSDPNAEENAELWWRLCKVTFLVTLNQLKLVDIKAKTHEAYQYGEKAMKLAPDNFQVNLWLANAAGKLSLLEAELKEKIAVLGTFLHCLMTCIKADANNHLVMFMEGRLQLALLMLTDEEKELIKQYASHLVLPALDTSSAEAKIRKSIEQNPGYIDGYITLAYLLVKTKKFNEAREVIDRGLAVERVTKSDELVARDLEKLKASLGKQEACGGAAACVSSQK